MSVEMHKKTHVETVTTSSTQPSTSTFQVVTWEKMRPWSTSVFDCRREGCGKCIKSYFCWPCIFCTVAKKLNEHWCATCFPGSRVSLRTKLRLTYGIKGTSINDCCCTAYCLPCAVCQMDREQRVVNGEMVITRR